MPPCHFLLIVIAIESSLKIWKRAEYFLELASLRGHPDIESSHTPSTLHVKMPNLPKIHVYNFRYKISVGMLMKLFFHSHKWINK